MFIAASRSCCWMFKRTHSTTRAPFVHTMPRWRDPLYKPTRGGQKKKKKEILYPSLYLDPWATICPPPPPETCLWQSLSRCQLLLLFFFCGTLPQCCIPHDSVAGTRPCSRRWLASADFPLSMNLHFPRPREVGASTRNTSETLFILTVCAWMWGVKCIYAAFFFSFFVVIYISCFSRAYYGWAKPKWRGHVSPSVLYVTQTVIEKWWNKRIGRCYNCWKKGACLHLFFVDDDSLQGFRPRSFDVFPSMFLVVPCCSSVVFFTVRVLSAVFFQVSNKSC